MRLCTSAESKTDSLFNTNMQMQSPKPAEVPGDSAWWKRSSNSSTVFHFPVRMCSGGKVNGVLLAYDCTGYSWAEGLT